MVIVCHFDWLEWIHRHHRGSQLGSEIGINPYVQLLLNHVRTTRLTIIAQILSKKYVESSQMQKALDVQFVKIIVRHVDGVVHMYFVWYSRASRTLCNTDDPDTVNFLCFSLFSDWRATVLPLLVFLMLAHSHSKKDTMHSNSISMACWRS